MKNVDFTVILKMRKNILQICKNARQFFKFTLNQFSNDGLIYV